MLWLDHKIFGSGRGMRSPYFDNRFYWLSGRLYTHMNGLGAQLHSTQWRHPNAGEVRRLDGREYRPLHSTRQFWWLFRDSWFAIPLPIARVQVAWSTDLPKPLDEAHATLRDIEKSLGHGLTVSH